MENSFLPIGTVVTLKEDNKKVMIIGFCPMHSSVDGKIYDYSACVYPEGLLSSDETLMFDKEQIKEIEYLGYQCEEETNFKNSLKDILNKFGSKNE